MIETCFKACQCYDFKSLVQFEIGNTNEKMWSKIEKN